MHKHAVAAIAALTLVAGLGGGCQPSKSLPDGGSDGGNSYDAGMQPPLSDATSLSCPAPGALPFKLTTWGYQDPNNAEAAADDTRNKDEASDTIGNPSGANANTYLADDKTPSAGGIDYRGVKARTGESMGTYGTPLSGEWVSLWSYDTAQKEWTLHGRAQTDDNGMYDLSDTHYVAPTAQPVYAVLEADGSCAEHYDFLLPSGSKVVVADIDGTLTLSDNELLMQLSNGAYVPKMMKAANTAMQAWAKKGYTVVYLTARPHVYRAESRQWLTGFEFPVGPVITGNPPVQADAYKTLWLKRMIDTFGWEVVAAYGNARTDITAYEDAGIPKEHTFIVGEYAGEGGTVAIEDEDYTAHIAGYIDAQPDNE